MCACTRGTRCHRTRTNLPYWSVYAFHVHLILWNLKLERSNTVLHSHMLAGHNWWELQTWIWIHITSHSQLNCWMLTWINAMTHIVHCWTTLLTPHVSYCWVLYVKVVVTQLFKKFFEFYEMWVFVANLTRAHHYSACHYPQIKVIINMDQFNTLFRFFSLAAKGHVVCMGEERGVHRVLVGKPEG
jgi:hypothetical protein